MSNAAKKIINILSHFMSSHKRKNKKNKTEYSYQKIRFLTGEKSN